MSRRLMAITGAGLGLALLVVGCSADVDKSMQPLEAVCVEGDGSDPDGDASDPQVFGIWVCPETLQVECDGGDGTAAVERIYVVPQAATCEDLVLWVEPGPFAVGRHEIVVFDVSGEPSLEYCRTSLTVVDTRSPEGQDRQSELWPPNHKMHEVTPGDCMAIRDDCDDDVDVRFTYVESDEPDDDKGDGHTVGDIDVLSQTRVALRAERMGGGNGRVYTLGWLAEDAAGNTAQGTCHVHVPHDQGGKPVVDDGPALRVEVQ